MQLTRKQVLILMGATLTAPLAGCSKSESGGNSGGATPAPSEGKSASKPNAIPGDMMRVALVLDKGGPDDKSFNAAAHEGLMKAKHDFGVEDHETVSKDASDYKTNLTTFANQGFDLVFAVGFAMEQDLKDVAPQFPGIKFAIADGNAPDLPNCAALQFKEEQGCFLVGFLAASMTKTKTIGFVGGMQIPLIEKFEAGYKAGAKTADPNVKVIASYTNEWEDINKGSTQADQQIGSGADIIFHAAGKCGLGVIQAIKEKGAGYYAIGVDRDQDDEAPGRVLTSMVKRLDVAVYDTIQRTKDGKFEPGVHLYDVKSGGIGLSEMKYTKKDVPAETLAKLDKITKMIADGSIAPPTSLNDLKSFTPPKV